MSGFAGIVRLDPTPESAEVDRIALARMAQTIAFRGPDAQQQWFGEANHSAGASFAFSLLTTGPAPQASSQPVTLDGETWLLGDVRCDDRSTVLAKLRQHGAVIAPTATSEELVLHFFRQFGEAGLPELEGDFSLVLWQPGKRRLVAYRDIMGARPFFYAHANGAIFFSNTLQALLGSSSFSRRDYDYQFIADFLLGAPHHDPSLTVYREVHRLPAGHLLDFSAPGLSVRRVANLPVEELLTLHDEEIVAEFRRRLQSAVKDRLPQGEAAIFLSGGLDSTSIAACIIAARSQNVLAAQPRLHSMCVDFQPLFQDDEARFAALCADALGLPLEVVHSGECLPFDRWEHSFGLFPEPLMDPYSSLYLSYRKEISKKARVAFSGDGGDELLRLPAAPYLRFLRRKHGSIAAVSALARWTLANRGLPSLGFGIRSGLLGALGRRSPEMTYPPWLTSQFSRELDLPSRWREMCAPLPPHPFTPKAYHAMNSGLFAEVQELYDPTWTGVPLETRNPFLDRRLVRFLLRVPTIPWAMNKHLLRVTQAGILPDAILRRPKTPLQGDPLVLHVAAGNWNPAAVPEPQELLRQFVDWPLLMRQLENAKDTALYVHLRPVALSFWLKAIEKPQRIQ